MRNMKKFLALVLAMLMVCSMAVMTTSAAEEADYTDAALSLAALKVMKGNENGDLMMDAGVTRYQTALFFVQALTGKTDAAVWNAEKKSATFADVIDYGTAIDYAAGLGIVKGRGNGVFGYNDAITYQDMIVMAIRALGYETADMQYPYGHILAAQKLELLENIDLVNYKAELKRGETAQLIWNMLQTKVAVVDPLTDKILYPGDTGLTDTITETATKRTTLLEESGFASATLDAIIVAFEAANEDDEDSVDTVKVDYTYTETVEGVEVETLVEDVVIAAADLGITADTPKVTYMGLPVTLFVDCAAADFDTDYADEEATIVFADFAEYTVVKNDGTADNIKYVANVTNPYLSLGGVKLADNKYYAEVYTFGADGWTEMATDEVMALLAQFEYTTKGGYVCEEATANTYCQVAYRITDEVKEVDDGTGEGTKVEKTLVEILYTPYAFGQYITRELKYNVTGGDTTFTIIGKHGAEWTNLDEEKTFFTEYFLGTDTKVTSTAVSKRNGEAASTVTLEGETVQSGDFMFYAYNSVDNILTVAANLGTIETGRMTATGGKVGKETVKIDGTNYGFGFAGLFVEPNSYVKSTVDTLIKGLETGKDNVQYLAVNGNIVFLEKYEGAADAASYGFAIVTLDEKIMAELLDTTVTKYQNALIGAASYDVVVVEDDPATKDVDEKEVETVSFEGGLYIDDGYVMAAVLNTTTGEWELGKIEAIALDYDDQDEADDKTDYDFTSYVDVATIAKYTEITSTVNGIENYVAAANLLTSNALFMVVEAEDGVYTLASAETTDPENNNAFFVERDANSTGLVFNTAGRTNLITASADVDEARVSTKETTVVVAIDGLDVQVRVGVQGVKKSITGPVNFYAADESLIVLTTDTLAGDWGTGSALASDATYFVALPDTSYEYGTTENENEYTLTITGLFDLKTMAVADAVVITDDSMEDLEDEADAVAVPGTVIYLSAEETFSASGKSVAQALCEILDATDDDHFVADVTEWVDHESITVWNAAVDKEAEGAKPVTNAANAINEIKATVVTLDLTDIDWAEDVDTDNFYVPSVKFDADEYEGLGVTEILVGSKDRYNYHIELDEVVAEISEPTLGLYSQFEIDNGELDIYELLNAKTVEYAPVYNTEYNTVAIYDEDAEVMTLYIVRLVSAAE